MNPETPDIAAQPAGAPRLRRKDLVGIAELSSEEITLILDTAGCVRPPLYAVPVPQPLVLTPFVISFATTALFLVVLIASRGFTGTDHVDGTERDQRRPPPRRRTGGTETCALLAARFLFLYSQAITGRIRSTSL
mgnify:CR=1 FL=1